MLFSIIYLFPFFTLGVLYWLKGIPLNLHTNPPACKRFPLQTEPTLDVPAYLFASSIFCDWLHPLH